jgi:2'-hydroxyisoflavone reductase
MKILVVGGTRFVGKLTVEAALERGHEVTLLHRGRTGDGLFPQVEHLLADRDGDLSVLSGRTFDATVDVCAYFPRQVRSLAATLHGHGGHYLFVSSVSAYAEPAPGPGFDETAPLARLEDPEVDVVTDQTYGGLKAVSEAVATELFGPETLLIRPTYVVGPDDYTWRFPWWVRRIAAGGEVLAPGPASDPAQVIDGRDQGAWMVRLLEEGRSGAFHAVSPAPPFTWGELLSAIVDAVGPPGTTLTWVDSAWLRGRGLGESAFPLWAADEDPGFSAASPTKAYAAGLSPRPLADTIKDTLAWIGEQAGPPTDMGLSQQRERELLEEWRGR